MLEDNNFYVQAVEAAENIEKCITCDLAKLQNFDLAIEKYYEVSLLLFKTVSVIDILRCAEATAKIKAKQVYNEAYAEAANSSDSKKKTVAELTIVAEQAASAAQLELDACTRALKLLTAKFDEAHNILKVFEFMLGKQNKLEDKKRILCE